MDQGRRYPYNYLRPNEPDVSDEKFITQLLEHDSLEFVSNQLMASQKFAKLINSNLTDDLLAKILQLVAKLCNCELVPSKKYIIKITMQQRFVKRINRFLVVPNVRKFSSTFNNIVIILKTALDLMPVTMWNHIKNVMEEIEKLTKQENLEFNHGNFLKLQKDIAKIEQMFDKPELNNNSAEDGSKLNEEVESLENFRLIKLFPDQLDLMIPEPQFVRKNIIDQPYYSIAQYLDIQFRLLREDFFKPIREDVCDYINNVNKRLFNVKIHCHVKFLERLMLRDRRAFKIQFHAPKWLSDCVRKGDRLKRFMNGTLLIFSSDDFQTLICGKVIGSTELHSGRILVDVPHNQPNPEYGIKYTMIECVLFFEPYHQVLSVLQKLNEKSLPMEEYILKISTKARPPRYMESVKEVAKIEGLNRSQEKSYRAAMTREFVIIQGPPGTGKTFIGMKIVEEIIKLREHWQHQGPILIICFTNHALDQFINGLQGATNRIARLGGKNNTTFKDLAAKYGPETLILDFLEEHLKYERDYYEKHGFFCGVRCNPDCDYLKYKEFVKMLKNKTIYVSNPFKDLLEKVPEDLRKWIEAKKVLGQRFFEIKQTERGVRRNHKKLHILNSLRPNVIFKTDFLFDDSCDNMYYYFDDFELACWLLCDDGSIKSTMDTLETVGVRFCQKYDEPSKVYGLLSDCIKEGDLNDWKVSSILTVESLKNYANNLEQYLENYPNQIHLREYLNFVKDKIEYFQTCLFQDFGPPEFDIANYTNPFTLSSQRRWQLYNHWIEIKRKAMKRELDLQMDAYGKEFMELNVLRDEDNVRLLKQMDIVGMTTTCAAKMRTVLEGLKNPIVVVEEAAEVLESHIIAALTENCQHLILVGDHQQLRPTTSDYTIETKFKLGISLFERMVINDVQCHTLNVQHRMRPEIADLIRPNFYSQLLDSDSVKSYPDVTGITQNLYFIDHTYPEEPYLDSSKMNRHEAEFLIQLTVYLLNNDYKPEEITILAAYRGQTYILRQERDKCSHHLIKQVRITPVDNFQGEENKIILLSLVRSNADNNIGFLAVDNRVVVALSRAREGFYIMGNMDVLCKATKIWKPVKATLESRNSIGKALPLCCRHHTDHVTPVSKPSDFAKVPEGGCNRACDEDLPCGHRCKRKCHGNDVNHENYVCHEPCLRSLCEDSDHKCGKICFEECSTECVYPVPKLCDICGEETMIECSKLDEEFRCETLVDTFNVLCLHHKAVPCYLIEDYNSNECDVEDEYKLSCGHIQKIPCNVEKERFRCQFDIKVNLSCGHEAIRKCHKDINDVICQKNCGKLLDCGHICIRKCHKNEDPDHKTYKCVQRCLKNKLGCNHTEDHPKCSLACWETCETCTVETISVGENCTHLNRGLCHAEKSRRCYKRCNKKLPCGHNCRKQCYDTCGLCYQKTFKTIPKCGHKIKVRCNETASQSNCRKICQKKLSCGHQCKKLCKDECIQVCNDRCIKILACGHKCSNLCNEECLETCSKSCTNILKCGHECIKFCSEECACKTVKYLLCDHFCDTKCGETIKPTCDDWECMTDAFLKNLKSMRITSDTSGRKMSV